MRAFVLLLALCIALRAVAQTPFCTLDGTGVQPYETLVDRINSPYALQVSQLEPDKKTVLMLASGTLYASSDSGHSFTKVDATANEWFSQIIRTADSDVVFLPSGTDIWVTLDKGATFIQRSYDTSKYLIFADYCIPHPTQGKSLACMSLNPLYPAKSGSRWQAVVTTDMGATWELVADYVSDVVWGYDPDHPTRVPIDALFISKITTSTLGADQTSFSRLDYTMGEYVISTKHWTPKVSGCPVFFQSEGDFVAPSYGTNKKGEIVLSKIWHSEDHGQQWQSYSFPINFYVWAPFASFAADSGMLGYPFYITDSATFFFTWDSNANYALYVSDSQDHGYSKAIERIHGFDFAPFESINGVFVANSYVEDKGNAARTSITYDNGGTWYPLRLPAGTRCPDRQPNCQLNLFGPSDDMFGRFYSWYDAVGLMIGTGTISEVLDRSGDVNTYLTSDGGLNWVKIRDGPTTYEFGDHGGLMVFAESGEEESTDIMYSWNGGNTFSECSITDKAFNMYNIITGNASSTEFWVYGERTVGNKTYGVVVLLDFSQFHESVCAPSDYEQFIPATPDNTSCILGQKTSYTRRKLDAECFNPASWESTTSHSICPCYEDDYECGYCYEYSKKDNTCKWNCDPDDEGKAPEDCVDVWYPNSNGWRLVPGTQCNMDDSRSLKRLGAPEVCPSSGPSSTTTMVVLTVLFVIILLTILAAVGFIAYSQNDSVKRWVNEKLNQAPADAFSISESALSDKAPLASADE